MGYPVPTTPAAPPAPAPTCPVCAEALAGGDLLACRACATPHHRGCWRYQKRCGTFACGGRVAEPWEPAAGPGMAGPVEASRSPSPAAYGAVLLGCCLVAGVAYGCLGVPESREAGLLGLLLPVLPLALFMLVRVGYRVPGAGGRVVRELRFLGLVFSRVEGLGAAAPVVVAVKDGAWRDYPWQVQLVDAYGDAEVLSFHGACPEARRLAAQVAAALDLPVELPAS